MNIDSAIRLVGQIIYRPGWTFTATDHSNRFEGTICVKIDYVAQETSRERAFEGYPENNTPYASFPIIVRDLDDVQLYRKIAEAILCIEEHEMREYLRIMPTGWAPFHPHQIDGMKRWNESAILDDLKFGIS